ncbi:MAG TPA: ABC transporter permease [Anaerolineaceae bacterium]|nr:ABC transporter permease [Anaerolineaceae bacterium]
MSDTTTALPGPVAAPKKKNRLQQIVDVLWMPTLAVLTSFLIIGIVIWITSGSLETVFKAYNGMIRGALIKERGLSESLVATVPYIFLSLGVAVGFKTGLFNIGVEGQFYIGSVAAAFVGQAITGLPALIHLPLAILAGAAGGAIWAGIPGFLKAKTGAHEVITTIMMNYISFRLVELLVSGPLKDKHSTAVQTAPSQPSAWVWTLYSIPERLKDPLNALGVALFVAFIFYMIGRWLISSTTLKQRFVGARQQNLASLIFGGVIGLISFFVLPLLTSAWWPFQDKYDRLHIGLILAIVAAVVVWWLLWKTSLGFELRTVGANTNAARYAGINITRSIITSMAISGALAGIAGAIEVLGVSACHCLPMFFSSGYGFESIAIALMAKNDPFGILAAAFLWGAIRNGADLMELNSGVSKYIISLIQALALLFVSAPELLRTIWRIPASKGTEGEAVQSTRLGG